MIDSDFAEAAAIQELESLKKLYSHLDAASLEAHHPDLADTDLPDLSDAMSEVAAEIEERLAALARWREEDVGEQRHQRSLGP